VTKTIDYPAPARAIYWGAREKMLEVGRLDPGDALEVTMYRKGFTYALLATDDDDRYIPPMRGHFYDIVEFFGDNPIKQKVYTVSVPRDKPLQYTFYNGEVAASCQISGDRLEYSFSKKEILPLKNEPRMVAKVDVAPKLLLSTTSDWFAKSTWFYNVNEDFGSFEATPEISRKVTEILKGARNEMDSVSRLTHWCADEIRYSGISMGEGEGFTLHKGAMTFTDRCGVCKDKAGMLITMLRSAGFKSYPAMTMAGSRIDYIPADQFNHCVTVVKLSDGKYHLLDPTWVPFTRELWSSAEQQQQYLMGVPEGADLATTPVSDPSNHFVKIDGIGELRNDGSLKGRVTVSAEGQSDAALRGMFRYSNKTAWYRNVEREILRQWPDAEVTMVKYSDPADYLNTNMYVSIDYIIPHFALVSGKSMIFTPVTVAGIFKGPQGQLTFDTGLKERNYPFRDRCSRMVEINESIRLPESATVVRMPSRITCTGEAASYDGGYSFVNGSLLFGSKAVFAKRQYEAAEWSQFRAAVEAQNRLSGQQVLIGF
jgi:transglutaminase-like putative cysteine protease